MGPNGIALGDGTDLDVGGACQALQAICQACGRGERGEPSASDYVRLRRALLADPQTSGLVPAFVRQCRTLDQLWPTLQEAGGYKDRDRLVWEGFRPLLEAIEASLSPIAEQVDTSLTVIHEDWITHHWRKALERRNQDPDGAITAARSFLEDVCRHVLDAKAAAHDTRDDLPSLYRKAARALNLGPDQHDRDDLKQILSGCTSVIQGFAAVRNRMGDAHGSGLPLRPAPRHAALAVNLAGAMATFLLSTLEDRRTGLGATEPRATVGRDE